MSETGIGFRPTVPAESVDREYEERGITYADVFGFAPDHAPVSPASASRLATVFACARVLAEAISILPLHVFDVDGNGQRDRNRAHAVNRIFNREMNPYQSATSGIEFLLYSWAIEGNMTAEIDFDGADRVVGMWPFAPNRVVDIRRGANGTGSWLVVGDPRNGSGDATEARVVDQRNIFHVPFAPGPHPVWGCTPIQVAARTFGVAILAEQFNESFYRNGAYLAGQITTPATMSKEARQQIAEDWRNKYSGAGGFKRTAVLDRGLKYDQLSVPSQDALFLESRKFQRREIAAMYRVPLHMIDDLEMGSSYAAIDAIRREFYQLNVAAPLKKIQQEVGRKLVRSPDSYAEFNRDAVLQGSPKERMEAYKIALGGGANPGILTVDEVRALENRPPVPGGDVIHIPKNVQPLGTEPEGDGSGSTNDDEPRVSPALVAVLDEAAGRIAELEASRTKGSAHKETEKFEAWARRYWKRAPGHMLETLRPAVLAVADALEADPDDAMDSVERYCVRHCENRMIDVIESRLHPDPADLVGLIETWKTNGGAQIRDAVMEMLGANA